MNRSIGILLVSVGLAAGCASSGGRSAGPISQTQTLEPVAAAVPTAPGMTVGELLAKGGMQLTAQQVKNVFAGATMEGASGNATWRDRSSPDGVVTGQTLLPDGQALGYEGTWWVDDQGRRCWANSRVAGSGPSCMYYYILDRNYFVSEFDKSHKEAPVAGRRINR